MKFFSRLIGPLIVVAVPATLIATADAPFAVPLACGVTWTTVGGTIMFVPDCRDSPPPGRVQPNPPWYPPPPPDAPPPGPVPPPGPPPP
ncbi:MAG TPA: hypothetical protein VGC05_12945, partial [Mycobacterium sp.]